MKFFSRLMLCAVWLHLSACASQSESPSQTLDNSTPIQLDYVDIASFDKDLSKAMAQKRDRIEVMFSYGFPVEEIPPRVGKWLSAVRETGGEVKLREESDKRVDARGLPLAALVPLVVRLYNIVSEKKAYSFSKNYGLAVLDYDSKDGRVSRMVFIGAK